jgi:hypothetical protein
MATIAERLGAAYIEKMRDALKRDPEMRQAVEDRLAGKPPKPLVIDIPEKLPMFDQGQFAGELLAWLQKHGYLAANVNLLELQQRFFAEQ